MRCALGLIAATLVLGACAGGLERNAPEPRVYRLSAPAAEPGAPVSAGRLLVLRPDAVPGLRTERIATAWPGNRIDYYAGARWSGELRAEVQAALVDSLRQAGRLGSVEGEPASFSATQVLSVEIVRVEADYGAGEIPVARVTLAATVGGQDDRRPLDSWTSSAEVAAAANRLDQVAAALDAAFGQAGAGVIERTVATLAADAAGQP